MTCNILVTGATGFLGRQITEYLSRRQGLRVTAVGRTAPEAGLAAEFILANPTDLQAMTAVLQSVQPDVVVQCAGLVRGTNAELFNSNVTIPVIVAEAIRQVSAKIILINIGSAAEYGAASSSEPWSESLPACPTTPYGFSKHAAALYLMDARKRGLRCNHIRVFNPVGVVNAPVQVIGSFIEKALVARREGIKVISMGPLGAVRDFVVIDDVAELIARMAFQETEGMVVNACSGEGRTIRQLIRHIITAMGGGFDIREDQAGSQASSSDVAIGNPALFHSVLGDHARGSVEDVLSRAWNRAASQAGWN